MLAASCTTPDVAPATDVAAPAAAQPDVSPAEIEHAEAALPPDPTPPKRSTPESEPTPAPAAPTPWGAPLQLTRKTHGLRFTTTAQVFRTGSTLQLALDVELHNTTRGRIPVALQPPLAMVMTTLAPGATGEGLGLGLGMRGEGMGSDVCSPGHGGGFSLRPDDRAAVARKLVDLDPLPWPPGQAQRVTATSRDCRPDRLTFEVIDVIIVQPASPDGVPTLVLAKPSTK